MTEPQAGGRLATVSDWAAASDRALIVELLRTGRRQTSPRPGAAASVRYFLDARDGTLPVQYEPET